MSEGYVKILSSILDSSIWSEPDDVVRVWLTILAMADRDGYVGASVKGIARRAVTVSPERTAECLAMFEEPDEDSRSDEFEGRRIQKVDRGYLILNYRKIRDMHGAEAAKARKRDWWNKNRGKESRLDTDTSSELARRNPMDLDLDLDLPSGSASSDPDRCNKKPRDRYISSFDAPSTEARKLFESWKSESGKSGASYDWKARQLFERLELEKVTEEQVISVVRGAKKDEWATKVAKLGASAILGSSEQREKFIELYTGNREIDDDPNGGYEVFVPARNRRPRASSDQTRYPATPKTS